jgi:hypothetical protein
MKTFRKVRTRWTATVGALLLSTTVGGAQGFSCLDQCSEAFGDNIIVNGKWYVLSSCSSIYHDGHYHTDCYYSR